MSGADPGNFGNDDASDWVYDLEESNGADLLKEAFSDVNAHSYEATDCRIALAAAEIIAAAKGQPPTDLPEKARKWLGNQEEVEDIKALAKKAIAVVNKISVKSDLRDEWEESDSWHEWQQVVEGLRRRLQG
ncbi:MAG TPA: DUF4259 domain-containing protein [Candidatus Angelobacter sp.]